MVYFRLTFQNTAWYKVFMKLQEYIKSEGLSISGWAKKVGISQPIISRFIAGKRGVSLKTALRIQALTGGMVRVDELINQLESGA